MLRDGLNKGGLPTKGKLIFLNANSTDVLEVDLPPEDVKVFEDELYDTYHAILECEDYTGCHELPDTSQRDKDRCNWCNFHYLKRDNAVLQSEEVVALDDE